MSKQCIPNAEFLDTFFFFHIVDKMTTQVQKKCNSRPIAKTPSP